MQRMKPPPRLTVSQWSDRYRHLSSEASAEPGRWFTSRAEYQRGIMDATSDPEVAEVVVMKSAQVGWTEIVNNVVGFHIHQDAAPILVMQPTLAMGEAWSKDRLAPMLRDSPVLRGMVGDVRSRDSGNTLLHKTFPGGHLTIAGANSAASLASRPIRVLLCDEVDRYPPSAGTEGDPITLGRKRTTTFWNRKVLIGSTPTIAGHSRIEQAYLASDRRRYWIPCPHCEVMQTLRWDQVRWDSDDAETAAYYCAGCGVAWTDGERWLAVRLGEWRAEGEFKGVAGFHISELYSPWRKIEDTVSDFLAAKGNLEQLKAWRNTALGESWQEKGDAPEWERLLERREAFDIGVVPARAVALTAGIDNQASPERLEVTVWAWGGGYESWPIWTEQIFGDPAADEPWDRIAELMAKDWPRESGGTIRIGRAAADTGGSHTAGVYAQLRRLHDPKLIPIKGVPGWNKASPVAGPTFVDLTIGGRKLKRGLKLWTVAVDYFKSELYRRLWLARTDNDILPVGWVHIPDWFDVEHVKQLVAEQLITVKDRRGFARREWDKMRANEQLDMAVYARAALSLMGSDRGGDRFWDSMGRDLEPEAATTIAVDSAELPRTKDPITLPPVVIQGPTITTVSAPSRASRMA